jgi:hypothetical protein
MSGFVTAFDWVGMVSNKFSTSKHRIANYDDVMVLGEKRLANSWVSTARLRRQVNTAGQASSGTRRKLAGADRGSWTKQCRIAEKLIFDAYSVFCLKR